MRRRILYPQRRRRRKGMQLYLLYHHVHQPLQGLFLYFIIYRSFELVSSKEFDEEEDMTKIEPIPTLDFTKLHYLELGYRKAEGSQNINFKRCSRPNSKYQRDTK